MSAALLRREAGGVRTIWELSCSVARRLAGRPVIVRPRSPIYAGDLATTQVNQAGIPVVDIPPDLAGGLFLRVLLHEVAHVKLHSASFARSNVNRQAGSVIERKPGPKRQAARDRREREAEELAGKWSRYADLMAVKVLRANPGMSDLEAKLWALLQFKER